MQSTGNEKSRLEVQELGNKIGYGNMMYLASEIWREEIQGEGLEGGEFVVGPARTGTVECGCKWPYLCDWCCGCGWLTKKVKQIKDTTP